MTLKPDSWPIIVGLLIFAGGAVLSGIVWLVAVLRHKK